MVEANSRTDCSEIDLEILRLKREIGKEVCQGHSCNQCKHFEALPVPTAAYPDTFFEIRTTPMEIWEDFAASGCQFWVMIRNRLTYVYSEIQKRYGSKFLRLSHPLGTKWHNTGSDEDSGIGYTDSPSDYVEVGGQHATAADRPVVVTVFVRLYMPEILDGCCGGCVIDFLPMALPDTTQKFMSTPINMNPQSPDTMKLVKQWIRKCDVEHKCGIGNRPPTMPSLLLDVSDQDNVKLVQGSATMGERYIALSYCWGTESQKVMLNQQTKDSLISGVKQQEFDPTIRDSITVVRELGFRYLWVDALCIFQDDKKFKATELGMMGKIYSNASFTIAASAAKAVQEGFLTRCVLDLDGAGCPAEGQHLDVFKVAAKRQDQEDALVILWEYNGEVIEPWFTRAWTLQELLFSGRRLEYRANQTTWTCYCSETTVRDCDGWMEATLGTIPGYSSHKKLYDSTMALLRSPGSSPPASTIFWYWYDLVDKYSQRELTHSADRLPAISGIAEGFASTLGDEYVCGMWKSDLPNGLLWRAGDSDHPSDNKYISSYPSDDKEKPRPSWSWVLYPRPGQLHWSWGFQVARARQNEDFEILGYDVDFAVRNAPFGGVTGARLQVRGLLQSIDLSQMESREDRPMKASFAGRDAIIYLDYKDDPRVRLGSTANLAFLLILNDTNDAWGIMVAAEGNNEYTRVGRFAIGQRIRRSDDEDEKSRRKREESRARWRSTWGGEENIRSIVLI